MIVASRSRSRLRLTPSSVTASGLPPVSSMIRSTMTVSSGPSTVRRSKISAALRSRSAISRLGTPANCERGSRLAKIIARRSACRRRATNARASSDSRSSQCASSTMHTSGSAVAASASTDRTAKQVRKRSAGGPSRRPSADCNASCWRDGRRSRLSPNGISRRCNAAYPRSSSDSTPAMRASVQPAAPVAA